ncbi:MAG: bifunctional 4-hydroxy-2-oxoglutarate aldolase/2-dehydro-3-deoxy-phosphogluconate aldolase [Chloroflexota bacterium]|nr:bifunctional 4-hydroxy-2-oxoglutarate aldolase/2-dehydro-3-deoxy-phosphogluconate aldolase [Chloroflexota bacterium]
MNTTLQQLGDMGLIPVVAIDDAEDAPDLGEALLQGGLPCVEITFRTAAATDAIQSIAARFPEMVVGAGTVLSVAQAEEAVSRGASFIVSPGFDPQVVDWCLDNDVAVMPGVMTPSEITAALNKDLPVLKFFPAEAAGGVKLLKAIGGPFVGVKFVPTGGINVTNLPDYLRLPAVHACGGSWIVKRQLIADGDFDAIARLTAEAVEIVRQVR